VRLTAASRRCGDRDEPPPATDLPRHFEKLQRAEPDFHVMARRYALQLAAVVYPCRRYLCWNDHPRDAPPVGCHAHGQFTITKDGEVI